MYIPDDVAVLIGFYSRERRYNGARRASLVHEGGLLSVNRPLLRIIYKLHLKRKIKPAKPAGFSFYLCLVFEREETPICTVRSFRDLVAKYTAQVQTTVQNFYQFEVGPISER